MKTHILIALCAVLFSFEGYSQPIIVNHTCTKVEQIPESAILAAKQKLHIAYGHTSHGSQLTDGMSELVAFMNNKGYPNNLYARNNGGTNGALDLHDYAMGGDVGYYPDWVNNTRSYLGSVNSSTGRGTGNNDDVNVIIWSWCGQVSGKYTNGTLASEYLTPMAALESEYFGIKFVYMTGHLDHWDDAANKAANQTIRNFCTTNNRILFDFADIESYNPDNTFYQYAGDDCSYYTANGTLLGNWATEWQDAHTVNVDWYECSSAHSQPLNANQKAYAAWWLWARLGGWNPTTSLTTIVDNTSPLKLYPNPSNGIITIRLENDVIESIEVFDITGLKVYSTTSMIGLQTTDIDLRSATKGVYLLHVNGIIKKFVLR